MTKLEEVSPLCPLAITSKVTLLILLVVRKSDQKSLSGPKALEVELAAFELSQVWFEEEVFSLKLEIELIIVPDFTAPSVAEVFY